MIMCHKMMQKVKKYDECKMKKWTTIFLNPFPEFLLGVSLIFINFILPLHNLSLSLNGLLPSLIKFILALKIG